MEKDWDLEECYTTTLNPIFRIWKSEKGYSYCCKTDYEENTDVHFKTQKELMSHIKSMLSEFAKEHRLLPWKYTSIQDKRKYKEDFGFGVEKYCGLFQAYTIEDAPEYARLGELVNDYTMVYV